MNMEELINESIMPMLNDGTVSIDRINNLIYIKTFVDRISTKSYIDKETARQLHKKYGVNPNIITWGDYFQTEMAVSLMVLPDDEFNRAVETLKFDMVASWIIFCEKDGSFFEWVESTHAMIKENKNGGYTEEEEEILHLKILKDYYTNLGLINNFTESEMSWFTGFQEATAI
ncbi:MAG: hypothetical protein A2176_10500 [Spirochaetes bacterium RBG_13_51_14]|nr:MAG: hypothetical protein A2176_10500 [Spirochaetes bacterium RBG_13_51_14]